MVAFRVAQSASKRTGEKGKSISQLREPPMSVPNHYSYSSLASDPIISGRRTNRLHYQTHSNPRRSLAINKKEQPNLENASPKIQSLVQLKLCCHIAYVDKVGPG
jgi:hypothetical protein